MITAFICLAVFCVLCFVGFSVTGALLTALFWVVFKLPIAIVLFILGIAFCCTIILIPVGVGLIGAAGRVLL